MSYIICNFYAYCWYNICELNPNTEPEVVYRVCSKNKSAFKLFLGGGFLPRLTYMIYNCIHIYIHSQLNIIALVLFVRIECEKL